MEFSLLPGYDPPCDKDPLVSFSFVDRDFSVPPVLHAHSDRSHSSDESEAQEEPPPPQASSSAPDSGSVMLRPSSRKSILPVDYETFTPRHRAFLASLVSYDEPRTYKEAKAHSTKREPALSLQAGIQPKLLLTSCFTRVQRRDQD